MDDFWPTIVAITNIVAGAMIALGITGIVFVMVRPKRQVLLNATNSSAEVATGRPAEKKDSLATFFQDVQPGDPKLNDVRVACAELMHTIVAVREHLDIARLETVPSPLRARLDFALADAEAALNRTGGVPQ